MVRIPTGAQVAVLDSVGQDCTDTTVQVNVRWDGKLLRVFSVDLRERGERV
jgi:hypothetical protein